MSNIKEILDSLPSFKFKANTLETYYQLLSTMVTGASFFRLRRLLGDNGVFLSQYLYHLKHSGLIMRVDGEYRLTEKGKVFLHIYESMREILEGERFVEIIRTVCNPIMAGILLILYDSPKRIKDVVRELFDIMNPGIKMQSVYRYVSVDLTRLGLVEKCENELYCLSELGKEVVRRVVVCIEQKDYLRREESEAIRMILARIEKIERELSELKSFILSLF